MVEWVIPLIIGALTGILSGMGIGGGTLLVLYLTAFLDTDPITAATVNLIYFCSCAPVSLIFHAKEKRINGKFTFISAVSGGIAALIAALLVPSDSPDWLRRSFGVLLLTIGVRELTTVIKAFHTEKNNG